MTQQTTTTTKRVAIQHPSYSALCILPGGKVETKAQAEVDGYAIEAAPKPAPVAPPKPAPVPVSPVKPPAAPVAPHDAAERVRVQRIIAMTPKGAEDECGDAIRSGMPVAEFEGVLAARTILEAARFVRGA